MIRRVKEPVMKADTKPKQPGLYAFFVLAAVTAVRTCYVVNKNSIGYAYGFQGDGFKANNPTFMLQAAYPQLQPIYGLVASLMFSAAYSTSNIFVSSLSKNWNKRVMLAVGVIGFSSTSLIAGSVNSLAIFAFMRFLFGIFASAINAPIYQLIATNFPPEFRATANSIENSGYFLGAGVASFMVLIIKNYGWRAMYFTMGGAGVLLGLMCALFIKNPIVQKEYPVTVTPKEEQTEEPEDSDKDEGSILNKFVSTIADLWKNPTARWVTLGGSFRFFEEFTFIYFLPSFYLKCYPLLKSEYGLLNGLI